MECKDCQSLKIAHIDNLKWYVCMNTTQAFLPTGRAVDINKKAPKWCKARPIPEKPKRAYYIKKGYPKNRNAPQK